MPASPGLVTAVFFNFHPAMVARALPDAWALASPEDVLAARLRTADVALRRLIPDHVGSPAEAEAAALAREAVEAPALAGRPCSAPCGRCPGPTNRTWSCGTPAPCCGNTGATATSPRSPPPASTAARPT